MSRGKVQRPEGTVAVAGPDIPQASMVKRLADTFSDDRRTGRVIGTTAETGQIRRGIDREESISIDNGALRIRPLIQSGWGRVGLAYEPYQRQNGLAFAVYMLNGHNTAQLGGLDESLRTRVARWIAGSEAWTRGRRAIQFLKSGRYSRAIRQLQWWNALHRQAKTLPELDENLAVGWFPVEVPAGPLSGGNALVMHATGPENGELWANIGNAPLKAIRSVQNLPIYYVVILRDRGAAYYAASVEGANGLPAFPNMRPLAIDSTESGSVVYPGVHQSVLGQKGFRLDTRVYGTRVEQLEELATWYGTAHAADRLRGNGFLAGSRSETGTVWSVHSGRFVRTDQGAQSFEGQSLATVGASVPAGLIHVISEVGAAGKVEMGVVWRFCDENNYWRLLVSDTGCRLSLREHGDWTDLCESTTHCLQPGISNSVQLLDDGGQMSFHLNGNLLFGTRFHDARLAASPDAGLIASAGDITLHSFEVHPRTVPLPEALRMGEPWLRTGTEIVLEDPFEGPAGDLEGRKTPKGNKVWRRRIGTGTMALSGEGAVQIQASAKRPNPGRTAYMVDWDFPGFADILVEITPPGQSPDDKEHGLCGLVFWQDDDNYITVNIWLHRSYGGASISCFFHLDGFEDLYDAIWSNVGKRIYYGVPSEMRIVFDGTQYIVFVNDEPVLYRKLSDVYPNCRNFTIRRVGLLANWEWGNDTGSVFRNFVGRV